MLSTVLPRLIARTAVRSASTAFAYEKPLQLGDDTTTYRFLGDGGVKTIDVGGKPYLHVPQDALAQLARAAMTDIAFFLRPEHNDQVAKILQDPSSSPNDRFVARTFLINAVVSAEKKLPLCQDTGTATVVGKRGHRVLTDGGDEASISKGIWDTYTTENLRYSQVAPLDMYSEKNTGDNLPAQIDLAATDGDEYNFLFVAKGGGSANKSSLFQMTKAVLNPASLEAFLIAKMRELGTAACPPYHMAFVVGGTSAETTMKTVKLASTHYLDNLPTTGSEGGRAFRDLDLEARLLEASKDLGIGAQFGGTAFAHDIRVIRLPRHGASCPIGVGVSCSADRNAKAKITSKGLFVEQLDENPIRHLAGLEAPSEAPHDIARINLNVPMEEIKAQLAKLPVSSIISLSGKMIVARDIAHARLKALIDEGKPLPDYLLNHPVYYAGPAKTPEGMPSGSFGPTTAGRMDSYVDEFQGKGGSMVMIAKGNRSKAVTEACKKHGGFYLGSIGGPAAILARDNIKSVKVLDMPELGMEAVWEIEVENFPAFVLVDDKGNDFFAALGL